MSTTLHVAMSIRQRGPSPSWQLRLWMQSQKRPAPVCLPCPHPCSVSPPTKDEPSPSAIWCFGIVYGSPKTPIRHRLNSDKETTSMKASVQAVPAGEVALSESTPIEATLYDLIAAIVAEVGPHEEQVVDVLPGMNAGASTSAVPSPMEDSGTAWVLLGAWALSPARPTPIHPRPERRGFSALLVTATVVYILNAYRVTCTGNRKGSRLICDTTALRRKARAQKIRSASPIE
jgi:hypothetical protein